MPDLADGEKVEMKGSGAKPYVLMNSGGVYSCTCPAWRNQSVPIERRSCKHLRALRGDAAEAERCAAPEGEAETPASATKVGETDGAPVLLAHSWDNAADLSGWWMSEKLDGVRGYWDGKQFVSRAGNAFKAPDWFVAGLPSVPLDGELWMDRRKFSETSGIVRRHDRSDHWKLIRFVLFDAPAHPGPFEERVAFLAEFAAKEKPPYARPVDHVRCDGLDHLRAELARVEGLGGEGLMLRRPGSRYEVGRSNTLLKVKTFRDDEAVVVAHEAGAGKHKGRLGALRVRSAGGVEFGVGTGFSDAERESPPPVGSVIVFRYQELSKDNVPRFPSFVGIRADAGGPAPAPAPAPKKLPEVIVKPEPPPGPITGERYFEFVEGSSSKFWAVCVSGATFTTRYGKIGSAGRSTTKPAKDETAARAAADKLIAEKTGEGYVEKPVPG